MKPNDINPGDKLRLKRDNPYGMGADVITVTEVRYRDGYRTPWIIADNGIEEWAFKPSDFSGRAES